LIRGQQRQANLSRLRFRRQTLLGLADEDDKPGRECGYSFERALQQIPLKKSWESVRDMLETAKEDFLAYTNVDVNAAARLILHAGTREQTQPSTDQQQIGVAILYKTAFGEVTEQQRRIQHDKLNKTSDVLSTLLGAVVQLLARCDDVSINILDDSENEVVKFRILAQTLKTTGMLETFILCVIPCSLRNR